MTTLVPDQTGAETPVPEDALRLSFVHASGPGGQHVNKVATAVELRLHVARSGLHPAVQDRLRGLAGSRLTNGDEIVIFAQESRSQLRNRAAALRRLGEMIRQAKIRPKQRVTRKVSRAAKRRRVDNKKRRSATKQNRTKPRLD